MTTMALPPEQQQMLGYNAAVEGFRESEFPMLRGELSLFFERVSISDSLG